MDFTRLAIDESPDAIIVTKPEGNSLLINNSGGIVVWRSAAAAYRLYTDLVVSPDLIQSKQEIFFPLLSTALKSTNQRDGSTRTHWS